MQWKQGLLIHLRSRCPWQKETWCRLSCKERNNDPLVSVLLYSTPKLLHQKLVLVFETNNNRTNPFNRDWYCILITVFYPHTTQKLRPILDNFCCCREIVRSSSFRCTITALCHHVLNSLNSWVSLLSANEMCVQIVRLYLSMECSSV